MYARTDYDTLAASKHQNLMKLCGKIAKKIDSLAPSREQSIALTKLDELTMWVGAAVAADQQDRKAKEKEKLLADIMAEADKHIGETSPVEPEPTKKRIAEIRWDGELIGYIYDDDSFERV